MGILIENCNVPGTGIRSVSIEGSRISMVSEEATQDAPDETTRLDAGGGTLLPAFTDSHCHPFGYGWLKRNIDLRGTGNITGLRLRLFARVQRTPTGDWVSGFGWDQEALSDGRLPNRDDIDDLSPKNPVMLSRVCGHISLLNTAAIESLGLEARTGAEYDRDQEGRLTGIVRERALEEAYANIPRNVQTCATDLQAVEVEAIRFGIGTLHCIISPGAHEAELGALVALERSGELSLRYRVYIPPGAMDYVEEKRLRTGLAGDKARINGVKLFADGSLGARTAALREPYSDAPDTLGLLRYTDEELSDLVDRVDSAGYQVIIHAIGDRAIEQAIGALSRVAGSGNPKRHRIEHASLLPKDLRSKMAKRGIRAAVQPLFITSDAWAIDRVGDERARHLHPLKSMLREGIVFSASSDAPVESMNPLLGVWASMTRGGLSAEEVLTLEEAWRMYTTDAGSNGLDEEGTGVAAGGLANLTLLDSDTQGMHPALLRKVEVSSTIIDGALAYSHVG